jgi:hypothetical protein
MSVRDFLPSREPELVTWVNTFNTLIAAGPTTYGLTAGQATSYGTLATNFVDAYNLANADATRSPSNIIGKNNCKKLLIASTRQLAAIIQAFPGTTNQMRSDLGLTVPQDVISSIPAPSNAPAAEVVKRQGTLVRVKLHDSTGERRGKPKGVQGARIYSHIGATPPVDVNAWAFEGQATRRFVDIVFPAETAPGTQVWLTACWYNPRGETGPACDPVPTIIAGGGVPMVA